MPLIHKNPLLTAGYGGEDLPGEVFPVWGQGQRHVEGIYHPPQDNLEGGSDAVPLLPYFSGTRLTLG